MFNKAIGFLSTFSFYIISGIIVVLILINMFLPSEDYSGGVKKEAERLYNELSVICLREGHLENVAKNDCVQDKLNILLGE